MRSSLAAFVLVLLFFVGMAPAQGQRGNLKLGRLYFDLTAYFEVEVNDNINASGVESLEDIILKSGVKFDGILDLSSFNSFSFNFDLGYRKYLDHPELDSSENFLDLSDQSELALVLLVGAFEVRAFDRASFTADATDSVIVDPSNAELDFNVQQYARFQNRVGLRTLWDMNSKSQWQFTIDRFDVIPLDTVFDNTRRREYTVGANFAYLVNQYLRVGPTASYFDNVYSEDFQNDSSGYSLGAFFDWQLTEFISLESTVSWVKQDFDTSGLNEDLSDTSTPNVNFALRHQLNSGYSHSFAFRRSTQFGFISNTTRVNRLAYSFNWNVSSNSLINGRLYHGEGADSGGIRPEAYDRFGFEVDYTHSFSSKFSGNFTYSYTDKSSNISERSYTQNRFLFALRYDF